MNDQKPLEPWTDERIDSAVQWARYRGISAGTRIMLTEMCDEWQQDHARLMVENAALRQQLAAREEWEPVADGVYTHPNWDNNGEVTLAVGYNGSELEEWHSSNPSDVEEIGLPDDIRLCRRKAQEPSQ